MLFGLIDVFALIEKKFFQSAFLFLGPADLCSWLVVLFRRHDLMFFKIKNVSRMIAIIMPLPVVIHAAEYSSFFRLLPRREDAMAR